MTEMTEKQNIRIKIVILKYAPYVQKYAKNCTAHC
jgi:hypothetical protein